MLEVVLWGIMTGFILSFVTGPAFFALLHTSVDKGFKTGVFMALGIVIADAIFLFGILLGLQVFLEKQIENEYVGFIGSCLIISYGIFTFFKRKAEDTNEEEPKTYGKSLMKGFLMIITNPGVLIYWVSIGGTASTLVDVDLPNRNFFMLILYAIILITQFFLDLLKCFFASKLGDIITPRVMTNLNRLVGLILVGAGIYLMDKLVFNFIIQ